MSDQQCEFSCRFVRETDAATLVEIDGEEYWIPLSQVSRMRRSQDNSGTIIFATFIAKSKGLI